MIPAPYAGAFALAVGLALGYVWLKSRCDSLEREINALETEKEDLEKVLHYEEYKWSQMKSPASIEAALAKHKLVMSWPRNDQVIRIPNGRLQNGLSPKKGNAVTYMQREKKLIHD